MCGHGETLRQSAFRHGNAAPETAGAKAVNNGVAQHFIPPNVIDYAQTAAFIPRRRCGLPMPKQ